MDTINEEVEIDLVRLFLSLMHKWKALLIFSIIFGALGYCYKYYTIEYSSIPFEEVDKQFKIERTIIKDGREQKETSKVSYKLYKEDYYAKKADYEQKVKSVEHNKSVLNDEIAVLENNLKVKRFYLQNSVLYNCDPSNYTEKIYYYTIRDNTNSKNTNSKISVKEAKKVSGSLENLDTESSVINYAKTLLYTAEYIKDFSQVLNLPNDLTKAHIAELISFNAIDAYSFSITFKGNSQEMISLLENVKEKFDKALIDFYGNDYVIRQEIISSDKNYNQGLINYKIDQDKELKELETNLVSKKLALDQQVMPIPYEGMGEPLIDLEKFKNKKKLIFGLAGIALGLFLGLCFYTFKYLFSGKLRDDTYISKCTGIVNLGTVHKSEFSKENADEIHKITESVFIKCKDSKSVAVVSSLRAIDCTSVASGIKKILSSNNIDITFVGVSSVVDVSKADAVIFMEKLDISNCENVLRAVNHVKFIGKDIMGIVYA